MCPSDFMKEHFWHNFQQPMWDVCLCLKQQWLDEPGCTNSCECTIICWTVYKWFTVGCTGLSLAGCLSRLHKENTQCSAQNHTTMRTWTTIVLNNTQVLCSVMKPFLPLSQAENNWNLGQWGTQGRRGSQHFSTDRHLNPLTIVKQKQFVCTGLYWVIVRHVVN